MDLHVAALAVAVVQDVGLVPAAVGTALVDIAVDATLAVGAALAVAVVPDVSLVPAAAVAVVPSVLLFVGVNILCIFNFDLLVRIV